MRPKNETFLQKCRGGDANDFLKGEAHTFLVWDLMTPAPPPGVENVKIRENSVKIRGNPTTIFRALGAPKSQKY